MTWLFVIGFVFLGYVAFILAAELLIWRLQPSMEGGVTISVTAGDGARLTRNLYGFDFDGKLYISSNHWFRRWYHLAVKQGEIDVTRDGVTAPHRTVVVTGEEKRRLSRAYRMGIVLRSICGFAPSKFLRLEPLTP